MSPWVFFYSLCNFLLKNTAKNVEWDEHYLQIQKTYEKGVDKKEKLWYNNKVVGLGHQEKTSKHGEKPQFERRIGKSKSGKARSG